MAVRSKRRVVIVGSGLAGSVIASSLSDDHDVVVIESSASSTVDGPILRDAGYPSNSEFFCGFGPGGSTAFWHNGLIEPPRQVFDSFPSDWGRLTDYIHRAHRLLSGVELEAVRTNARILASRLEETGFQRNNLGSPLYYPNQRINAWNRFVQGTVPLVIGNVIEFVSKDRGRIHGVRIATDNGETLVEGDIFVLSAGGLMSPVILAGSDLGPEVNLKMAGLQYEDHPMGFVGSVELTENIAGLWNHHVKDLHGFLRIPLVLEVDSLQIAFYLRPATDFKLFKHRAAFQSALSDARNERGYIRKALKLFSSVDDVIELAAIKCGVNFPSKKYSLLMFAEQPSESRIYGRYEEGKWHVWRDWKISPHFLDRIEKAVSERLLAAGPFKSFEFYPGWKDNLKSGGHHSGSCRAGKNPRDSVSDANGRVWGTENLYVCDGSFIPRSGYCNTGLLIASLALRLSETIRGVKISNNLCAVI